MVNTTDSEPMEVRKARISTNGNASGNATTGTMQREAQAGYEHLKEAATNFKGAATAARDEARIAAEKGMDSAKTNARDLYSRAEAMVHERPLAALGAAFLAGYVISRLMRR